MKMVYKIFIISGLLLSLPACRTVYQRPEFAKFAKDPSPLIVFNNFKCRYLTKATLYQNAIIDIKGRSMAAIGLCSYDTDRQYIALSLLAPTGIKLIEVAEFNGKRRRAFAIAEIASGDKAVNGIADDIKRIYFQPTVQPINYSSNDTSITFYWTFKNKKLKLKFGKSPDKELGETLLFEKHIYINNTLIGSVFYYDYKKINNKIVPMRIRYENYKYDYNLILKNNEVVEGE